MSNINLIFTVKTCSELREAGMKESGIIEIQPLHYLPPFWVYCNMDDRDGIGITEIGGYFVQLLMLIQLKLGGGYETRGGK